MPRNKISLIFSIFFLTAIAIAVSLSLNSDRQVLQTVSTASLIAPLAEKTKSPSVQILFVGDIMLDRGIRYYSQKAAEDRANDFVFEKIHGKLLENNLVVGNLEGPITNNSSVSITAETETPNSFFFTFDPSWAKTLFDNKIRLVNLGNNHILNFGAAGLAETKNYLKEAGVDYFGAPDYPKNIATEINGVKITFINYNEFSAYAEIEESSVIEEIKKTSLRRAESKTDIIIVYTHWGAEYMPEPAPEIKKLARAFIDAGADLIIGSHPHVIQPIEIYKGKRIYYSLGNFIFDQYFSEETKMGLGVVLKIEKTSGGKNLKLEFEEINFYMQENSQTVISE